MNASRVICDGCSLYVDDLLEDLAEAVDAAAELVALGKDRWDAERPLCLAGEAVAGRLGDITTKLCKRPCGLARRRQDRLHPKSSCSAPGAALDQFFPTPIPR